MIILQRSNQNIKFQFRNKKLYYQAFKLEGIKKHISTHAAGVVMLASIGSNYSHYEKWR